MSSILRQHLLLHTNNQSNHNNTTNKQTTINNTTTTNNNKRPSNKQSNTTISSGYVQSIYKQLATRAKKYTITQHNISILTGVNQHKNIKKQDKLTKQIIHKQNKPIHIHNKYNKRIKPDQVGIDTGRKIRKKERTTLHKLFNTRK